jgi:hypothetical protein
MVPLRNNSFAVWVRKEVQKSIRSREHSRRNSVVWMRKIAVDNPFYRGDGES